MCRRVPSHFHMLLLANWCFIVSANEQKENPAAVLHALKAYDHSVRKKDKYLGANSTEDLTAVGQDGQPSENSVTPELPGKKQSKVLLAFSEKWSLVANVYIISFTSVATCIISAKKHSLSQTSLLRVLALTTYRHLPKGNVNVNFNF